MVSKVLIAQWDYFLLKQRKALLIYFKTRRFSVYTMSDANSYLFIYFRQVSNECYTENYCLVLCQPSTITSVWLWGVSSPIMLCAMVWYLLPAAEHYAVESLNHSVFDVKCTSWIGTKWFFEPGRKYEIKRATCVINAVFRHFDENSCMFSVAMELQSNGETVYVLT